MRLPRTTAPAPTTCIAASRALISSLRSMSSDTLPTTMPMRSSLKRLSRTVMAARRAVRRAAHGPEAGVLAARRIRSSRREVLRVDAAKRTPMRLLAKRLRSSSTSLAFSATSTPTSQASIVVDCSRKRAARSRMPAPVQLRIVRPSMDVLAPATSSTALLSERLRVDLRAGRLGDDAEAVRVDDGRQRRLERDAAAPGSRWSPCSFGRRHDEQRFAQPAGPAIGAVGDDGRDAVSRLAPARARDSTDTSSRGTATTASTTNTPIARQSDD